MLIAQAVNALLYSNDAEPAPVPTTIPPPSKDDGSDVFDASCTSLSFTLIVVLVTVLIVPATLKLPFRVKSFVIVTLLLKVEVPVMDNVPIVAVAGAVRLPTTFNVLLSVAAPSKFKVPVLAFTLIRFCSVSFSNTNPVVVFLGILKRMAKTVTSAYAVVVPLPKLLFEPVCVMYRA